MQHGTQLAWLATQFANWSDLRPKKIATSTNSATVPKRFSRELNPDESDAKYLASGVLYLLISITFAFKANATESHRFLYLAYGTPNDPGGSRTRTPVLPAI